MKHRTDAVDRRLAAFIDQTGCLDEALNPRLDRSKQIYSAIRTAKASLIEMSELIEGLSDLTAETIRYSAGSTEAPRPDEIRDRFAEFYGREQKRANEYKNWQRGGQDGKAPPQPLHMLSGKIKNGVLLALFESGKIRTITKMLGIGADVDKTLKQDAGLRELLGSVSGFGGDHDEFQPAEETPMTNSYAPQEQYAGQQLYTDPQTQGGYPHPDPRYASAYYPRYESAYDPMYEGAYDRGYDQRTLGGKARSIFSLFRENGIVGYIGAAAVVFCLYLVLCYFLQRTGNQWWICGLYDTVMGFFKASEYVHKMSQQQAGDVMVDIVESNQKVRESIEAAAKEIAASVGVKDPNEMTGKIANDTAAALKNIRDYIRPNGNTVDRIVKFASDPENKDAAKAMAEFLTDGGTGITLTTIFPRPVT